MPDQHEWMTVDLAGLQPPTVRRVMSWLYELAEDAAFEGLPLDHALQVVRDGYSSFEANRTGRDI